RRGRLRERRHDELRDGRGEPRLPVRAAAGCGGRCAAGLRRLGHRQHTVPPRHRNHHRRRPRRVGALMAKREAAAAQPELRAVDGRVPGRRGRATRDRLLKCTAELLERTSYRDITVIDIASCAGTSPATFYQYFQDVNAAIAVLAGELAEQGAALTDLIENASWTGRAANESAMTLVDAFLSIWEEHRAV